MKIIRNKALLVLYGCSGIGVNLLGMIMGSYLCSALVASGFGSNSELWTFLNKDIVAVLLWGVLATIVKVFDGVIDIPFSTIFDNLRTRWGRRRPSILIGLVATVATYVLFTLVTPENAEGSLLNTIWYAVILMIFYSAYTLTMLAYYATFSEIVDNDRDRAFLSTTKSICDVIYFSISFALVPVFINVIGLNIRPTALIFLPCALTMLIPLFMIKEPSTKNTKKKDTKKNDTLPQNKREVLGCILLTVITLGGYGIYWHYRVVKTLKTLQGDNSSCAGEMLCILFVPFYWLYWWYTRGEIVRSRIIDQGGKAEHPIVYLIFAIFDLEIVSLALMQKNINILYADEEIPRNQDGSVSLARSLSYSLRDVKYLYWLCILMVMNFGLQLFLSGINEFFSHTDANMTFVMASAFAPVPFTLQIYNRLMKKKGLKHAFQYALLMFSAGMTLMLFSLWIPSAYINYFAILCGVTTSFGIGAFFSVTYMIPAQLAAEAIERDGERGASSMYFAVQGLFEAIAAGLATGIVLNSLKLYGCIPVLTVVVAFFCMAAFVMAFFMPKSIALLGKANKND